MEQKEIWVPSSFDGTLQPSLFYKSKSNEKRPLLVGLHTWSYGRYNQIENMLPYAEKYDFNLLLPEFRGANLLSNPYRQYACGSEYAKQDVQDAIEHVIANEAVDEENVFLLGCSGGGHMALLMAGKCPELFKAVGAYVPITDLHLWIEQNKDYAPHVKACCGNEREMLVRSPVYYKDKISRANLKIFHGKFDSVVPVAQSVSFYNELLKDYPNASIYLDVFDGGHEMDMEQAMYWLLSQYERKDKIQVTG